MRSSFRGDDIADINSCRIPFFKNNCLRGHEEEFAIYNSESKSLGIDIGAIVDTVAKLKNSPLGKRM